MSNASKSALRSSAKRAGVEDIVKKLGVSRGTVDRALHNRPGVNQRTKERVLQAARQLGYRPNLAASYLSSKKQLTIGICLPVEVAYFYDAIREGIFEAASSFEPLGVKTLHRPYKRFGQHETEALQDLLSEDIRGLIISPAYPERLQPYIDRAVRRGIPVVCVATDAPRTGRLTSVSVDPHTNGALAGELLAHLLPPGAAVAVFIGMRATVDHQKKLRGFRSAFERFCPRGKIAAVIEAHDEEEEAYEKCRKIFDRQQSVRGIYVSTANSVPVVRALDDLGLSGRTKVIGTDLFPAIVPLIETGKMLATLHQRPREQGLTVFRAIIRFLTEDLRPAPQILLDPAIVMRSNLSLFLKDRRQGLYQSPTLAAPQDGEARDGFGR